MTRYWQENPEDRAPRVKKTAQDKVLVREMAARCVAELRAGSADSLVPPPPPPSELESKIYRELMSAGLENSRKAPPTEMQRIAATLDEKSQGKLAPGYAITPRMIEHMANRGIEIRPLAETSGHDA